MLLDMLMKQPHLLGEILARTPRWVWVLLAGLIGLGLSQTRGRTARLKRILLMPVAMAGLSLWSMWVAFGASPSFGPVILMWMIMFAATVAVAAMMNPPANARYDASARTFTLAGSWVPMALIVGIFLMRYWVNVEIAIAPNLARDGQYTLVVGALYGLFSGLFAGRAARLAKLALPHTSTALILQGGAR